MNESKKERIKKELQKHKVKIMEEGVWIDVGMSKPWEHEADSSFYWSCEFPFFILFKSEK